MIKKIFSIVISLKIIFRYFVGIGVLQKFPKKAFRKKEKLFYDFEKCNNCQQCISICPVNAISFDEKQNKVLINENDCVHCVLCAEKCSQKALKFDYED